MFESKLVNGECPFIGNFVDVFEFGERWNRFSSFQKAVLKSNCYVGTLDDFALHLNYSAPMASPYRKQIEELEKCGLIHVVDFNQKYFESHKEGFDYYDFEHSPKRRSVKMFFIPEPSKLVNMILMEKLNNLPDHNNNGSIVKKSHDLRDVQNAKRRNKKR